MAPARCLTPATRTHPPEIPFTTPNLMSYDPTPIQVEYQEFIAYFGKGIAGEAESGGGFASAIMDANASYKPPTPKAHKQRGLTADEADLILKKKMAKLLMLNMKILTTIKKVLIKRKTELKGS